MGLVLHGVNSSRAIRCLWMLEELGLAFQHVAVDFRGATRSPEFLVLNPNGRIPVLEDEGLVLCESLAINLHLARRAGGPLSAHGAAEDARCLMWSFWAVNEIERDCVAILLHRQALPPERRKADVARQAEGRLRAPLAVLEAHLQAHEHLAAPRFTVADLNVAAILAWSLPAGDLLAPYPVTTAWLKVALRRPAYTRALAR